MPKIRVIDMQLIDNLFQMEGGYVLNFSDKTMASFFANELDIDIGAPEYLDNGTSKAKRLRCFLTKVDEATAVRALTVLWEYREADRQRYKRADWVDNAEGQFLSLLGRLRGGSAQQPSPPVPPAAAFNRARLTELKTSLLELINLAPQPRGYAFESWLKNIFDLYGLKARQPFRLIGEQIDGSFELHGETYLVEAKWQSNQTGVADLHAFEGKLAQKAAWTRGLFVSNSGFTPEGLTAFGRGKRVICMDGLDLHDCLERQIPLDAVLQKKVRNAAETGMPFSRVRDLFPH
jgi:hypothetical protein